MKERPILFSAPMVRALLCGTKTQTRRVVKLTCNGHAKEAGGHRRWHPADPDAVLACPYGQPGDRLWVREAWSGEHCYQQEPPSQRVSVMTPDGPMFRDSIWYWADGQPEYGDWERQRPSIHMPRWASRITLEVTGVRLERLQDISEADAIAEGCHGPEDDIASNLPNCPNCGGIGLYTAFNPSTGGALPDTDCRMCDTPVKRYRLLWESINGSESWEINPWVWVVSFKRLEQPA